MASGIVTSVVYDKVIPHHDAMATLWTLAVGAAVFGIAGKVGANEQFPGSGSGVVGVAHGHNRCCAKCHTVGCGETGW